MIEKLSRHISNLSVSLKLCTHSDTTYFQNGLSMACATPNPNVRHSLDEGIEQIHNNGKYQFSKE